MLARVYSCAVIGLEGVVVEVEVYTADGLPDAAVQESRERVQAAIKNAGLHYPRKRLVNSRTKVCQGFAATLRQQFSATLHHLQGVCK